jgi:hypothetical protein
METSAAGGASQAPPEDGAHALRALAADVLGGGAGASLPHARAAAAVRRPAWRARGRLTRTNARFSPTQRLPRRR